MLVRVEIAKAPSCRRLIKLWEDRYTPNLFALTSAQDPWVLSELLEASSPEGRALTVSKLQEPLVNLRCELAVIQAKMLYEYISDVLNLREARQLTECALQIYIKLLELYQQPPSIEVPPLSGIYTDIGDTSLSIWGIPDIDQLATAVEPVLLQLQKQHVASMDWRALGFMTTQLNLTNNLLLQKLTPIEQVLITPYFKFVEEQVAIPWKRICAAAARYEPNSPELMLVEQMLPASLDVAWTVYRSLFHQFPNYRSRRGPLNNPAVIHSCIRDLEMFQAYLWLSVLEKSLLSIKQELITLCIMVMESVEITQEFFIQAVQLLMHEIISRISPEQKTLLLPYIEGIQQAFYVKRNRLGIANENQVAVDLDNYTEKPL
jgi:hypothetical protein